MLIKDLENLLDYSEDDIADTLYELKEEDLGKIIPVVPELAIHDSWMVRIEVVRLIGDFKLKQFTEQVRTCLQDKKPLVRNYAISACYKLEGQEALPVLQEFRNDSNVPIRLNALSLLYVELGKRQYLQAISKIVTRKNCSENNQYLVFHTFLHYLKLSDHPKVLDLFEKITQKVEPSSGIYKDLKNTLVEFNYKPT